MLSNRVAMGHVATVAVEPLHMASATEEFKSLSQLRHLQVESKTRELPSFEITLESSGNPSL